MDIIIMISIAVVLAIVTFVIILWYEIFGNSYARALDQAIKDMEKGITTEITDLPNGSFSVKKYKDEEKIVKNVGQSNRTNV